MSILPLIMFIRIINISLKIVKLLAVSHLNCIFPFVQLRVCLSDSDIISMRDYVTLFSAFINLSQMIMSYCIMDRVRFGDVRILQNDYTPYSCGVWTLTPSSKEHTTPERAKSSREVRLLFLMRPRWLSNYCMPNSHTLLVNFIPLHKWLVVEILRVFQYKVRK